VTDKPIDDLGNEKDRQTKGSCTWITEREDFLSWFELTTPATSLYWIHAPPATGKTVLAAHIITHVQSTHRDCSYYFFKHGEQGGDSISAMLRSFALQMAQQHPDI
jgi:SpoVK/Ycf46/Vps4 family AAA+-type ATPase